VVQAIDVARNASAGTPPLEARAVSRSFATTTGERHVLADVTFTLREHEFLCVVGPSGCGKTTLLRLFAGLLGPSTGEVLVRGQKVTSPHPDIALVFQDYGRALCPWRTVIKNVELPLENRRVPRAQRRLTAESALARVNLSGHERDYPRQLSGGMQQRLQIARALAYAPKVLLMDEPFASLDALTRFRLEDTTLRLWTELEQTLVLVTHDLDEAIYLADRIIVLTASPATVAYEISVELPRPRDQAETRASSGFVRLRHELFERIRMIEGFAIT